MSMVFWIGQLYKGSYIMIVFLFFDNFKFIEQFYMCVYFYVSMKEVDKGLNNIVVNILLI